MILLVTFHHLDFKLVMSMNQCTCLKSGYKLPQGELATHLYLHPPFSRPAHQPPSCLGTVDLHLLSSKEGTSTGSFASVREPPAGMPSPSEKLGRDAQLEQVYGISAILTQ